MSLLAACLAQLLYPSQVPAAETAYEEWEAQTTPCQVGEWHFESAVLNNREKYF